MKPIKVLKIIDVKKIDTGIYELVIDISDASINAPSHKNAPYEVEIN